MVRLVCLDRILVCRRGDIRCVGYYFLCNSLIEDCVAMDLLLFCFIKISACSCLSFFFKLLLVSSLLLLYLGLLSF